ncbi:hypothetical protein YC2023_027231 [Brassica napus]
MLFIEGLLRYYRGVRGLLNVREWRKWGDDVNAIIIGRLNDSLRPSVLYKPMIAAAPFRSINCKGRPNGLQGFKFRASVTKYFRIDHMLNNRSIRKKMVDLLGQDHPKPVNKPKTILNQHERIPDSARNEVFRDKRLNEVFFAYVDALWSLKYYIMELSRLFFLK